MSKTNKIFEKIPVKIQDRSGFDMSHENLFTAKVGTLIPASVEEVMPGDVVSVGSAMSVELPPLATNFKGRVDARLEAFFVPNRIIWAGWKDFIVQSYNHNTNDTSGVPSTGHRAAVNVPKLTLGAGSTGPGTLADYLGIKQIGSLGSNTVDVNALPFLAYQKIIDDWYRDPHIQNSFFTDGLPDPTSNVNVSNYVNAANMPWMRCTGLFNSSTQLGTSGSGAGSMMGVNGRSLAGLAQRNFAKDYYTTMTHEPQAGAASELRFEVGGIDPNAPDASGDLSGTGTFSIASLRAANALQEWLERNNIAGTRYYDQILAHYGVLPSDACFDRAVLLGALTSPVIVNSIASTNNNNPGTGSQYADTSATIAKNPYGKTTGAQFGNGRAFGSDRLINDFEVKEHGYIIIMFSLVPHAYYGTGSRRYLTHRFTSSDYAFPEFAGIGDQPIYKDELHSPDLTSATPTVLGYAQRYSEYKFHDDEVHGLLADGQSLDSFVLQRGFDNSVQLVSSLIQIPQNYMDDVMVVASGVSGFNAVIDCFFDAKYLRVLPEYSLPSLCDCQNKGKTVKVPKGGRRL